MPASKKRGIGFAKRSGTDTRRVYRRQLFRSTRNQGVVRESIPIILAIAVIFLTLAFVFVNAHTYFTSQSTGSDRTPIEMALGTSGNNNAANPGQAAPPTPTPAHTPAPIPSEALLPKSVMWDVPFTPQAPLGNWSDPRQESGCEEAGALMALSWAKGTTFTLKEAEQEIIAISDYEQQTYGGYHDTAAQDTVTRIFEGYFHYDKAEVKYHIAADDIKAELAKGNLVLVPTDGQKLYNPFYRPPGPLQHELVIKGYDDATQEFIVNDPGTRKGNSYRYPIAVVMNADYDYATGNNEPVKARVKAMIVVSR